MEGTLSTDLVAKGAMESIATPAKGVMVGMEDIASMARAEMEVMEATVLKVVEKRVKVVLGSLEKEKMDKMDTKNKGSKMSNKLKSAVVFLLTLTPLTLIQACEKAVCDSEKVKTHQHTRAQDGAHGASATGGQDAQKGQDGQKGTHGLNGGHGGHGGNSEWGKGGDGGNGGDAD